MEKFLTEHGQVIQGFPLYPGQVNIAAAGGAKNARAFCCAVDGTFTVTFNDGTDEDIPLYAGDTFVIPNGGMVLATGGAKFHYV